MKELKKGLRLNEVNRKEITALIVDERMGEQLADLLSHQHDITVLVERALMGRLTDAQKLERMDLETIPDGALPVVKRLYLGQGFADPKLLVDFAYPVRVPFCFYSQGNIDPWQFEFDKKQKDELHKYAAKRYEVRGDESEMRAATMTFLNGFTSPQKLLAAAPDFEKYLPEDMFSDEEKERVTLDDILGGPSKADPKPEEQTVQTDDTDDDGEQLQQDVA